MGVVVEPDNDDGEGFEPIVIDITGTRRSWIATGTVMSACILLIVITRYRYSISVSDDDSVFVGDNEEGDSSSSGAFVDISTYDETDQIRDEGEGGGAMSSMED